MGLDATTMGSRSLPISNFSMGSSEWSSKATRDIGSTPSGLCSNIFSALTDIEAAMYTMSLNSPDGQWYMDTGATSHMTASQGNLSSYYNMSNSNQILLLAVDNEFQFMVMDNQPFLHLHNL